MPTYTVKVKWGKEIYQNVEVNTDEEPLLFKAQLFALTGVQPERQKIMLKGVTLKDDSWNAALTNNMTILMMGTRDELVSAEPVERVRFLEDMNENEIAVAMKMPAGLTNLGNTCYVNATVQCLRCIPELRTALAAYKDQGAAGKSIAGALRDVFGNLESGATVQPLVLLQLLYSAYPQFTPMTQQDANECWMELMKVFQQTLKPIEGANPEKMNSFVEQFLGGKFDIEMKCIEAADEPATKTTENFLQLTCFISPEVKYMHSGLRSKMLEKLVKNSPSLGRDAEYKKTALISRLPAYLAINFMRFQYKGKEGINAKVLKDIKFPIDFDAYDLCTPQLQEKLTPMRARFKAVEDAHLDEMTKKDATTPLKSGEKRKTRKEPFSFPDDVGSNNSGYYTLQAVLTHQGRTSSSGHYVGWVRLSEDPDKWVKFDDDVVTPVSSEDVLRLSGGGDWHCAYVLVYGPRVLEVPLDMELPAEGAQKAVEAPTATTEEPME